MNLPRSTPLGLRPRFVEGGLSPFGPEFLVPRQHFQALSCAGTGSQRCQSPQALLWIVSTLLDGDGKMESDCGYDLTRSQSHE
ncbi:hypothetical protein K0C01_04020 [Salinarchaeum sp. IM2453]|uniref:hypothetical protein n=1 Tax=Salinarchaeum sp. IM2453 TaxID=2862870 RepID=UPI001C82BB39|nr:hypothetical protein [Salinarchaeum sp. IM2453]QZA89318.1 hypothetical protein K0C01_04020 [Salinarchaeum sp. IM2453]